MKSLSRYQSIKLRNLCVPGAFGLLTLKDSTVLIDWGLQGVVEYGGLLILLIGAIRSVLDARAMRSRRMVAFFFVVAALFTAGLLFQNLGLQKKTTLIISGFLLAVLAIFPNVQIRDCDTIKRIAYAIVLACVITTLLALGMGYSVFEPVNGGGIFSIAFTAGQKVKNYVAYEAFAAIIAMCFYLSIGKIAKTSVADYCILALAVGIMISSNSKSVFPILLGFFVLRYACSYRNYYRTPLLLGLAVLLVGIVLSGVLFEVLSQSATYMMRFTGVTNYLQLYSDDVYHMIFGNAEMAFRESGYDYVRNLRSVTGWDGSAEIAWLDMLVKNGLLGIIAYFLLFGRIAILAKNIKNQDIKVFVVVLLFTFFATTFVESYACTLHTLFGPFCYVLLASLVDPLFAPCQSDSLDYRQSVSLNLNKQSSA